MNKEKVNKISISLLLVVSAILLLFLVVFLIIYLDTKEFKAGTLGDAFNGLSAPFIALLSAGLLYYSFKQQILANERQYEANELLKTQWFFELHLRKFRDLKSSFENLEVVYVNYVGVRESIETFKGVAALECLAIGHKY
jgi:hypothetical protein